MTEALRKISIISRTLSHLYSVSKLRLLTFSSWLFVKSLSEAVGVFSLYAVVHQLISADRAAPIKSILAYLSADPSPQNSVCFLCNHIFCVDLFSC